MKKAIFVLVLVGLVTLGYNAHARNSPFIGTLGYTSLDTHSLIAFDLHVPVADDSRGIIPELVLQIGGENGAAGINLGLSYVNPEHADKEMYIGNITLFGKGRWKVGNDKVNACLGTQLELSLAPGEVNGDDWFPQIVGFWSHLRYGRYWSKTFFIVPQLAASVKISCLFFQLHVGPEIMIPFGDDEYGQDRDTETSMTYGAAAGITAGEFLSLGVGFRGLSLVTQDDDNTFITFDVIAQGHFGKVSPMVMISIPLEDEKVWYSADNVVLNPLDVIVSFGVTVDF